MRTVAEVSLANQSGTVCAVASHIMRWLKKRNVNTGRTTMNAINIRKFGRVGFDITDMGFGAAPIGNFLRPIPEEEAGAMVERAWEAGMRYFDTAPYYGHGLSELRLGHYLRWKPRDQFVVSSKVGRVLKAARKETIDFKPWVDAAPFKPRFDYSYDGTMRSFEDSLQRLGLGHIDILFIHDADVFTHGPEMQKVYFKQAMDGCYRALIELREQGLVKAIGVGVNNWEVMLDFMKAGRLRHAAGGRALYAARTGGARTNCCRCASGAARPSSSAAASTAASWPRVPCREPSGTMPLPPRPSWRR